MENIYNFNEHRLKQNNKLKTFLFILIAIVVIAVIFVLTTCNFTNKYGIIPTDEKLSSGDKILYVLSNEKKPNNIEYNKENSEICLTYDQVVYDTNSNVKIFFVNGKLSSLVYAFDGINEDSKFEFSKNIINNIENKLDDTFSSQIDIENCKANWKYLEGAKSENIEFYVAENNAYIIIEFQF